MPIMRRAAAALMTSPMIFGHRTGKAVRKARDIPDLPVLETGGNHGGLVYADISALVRLLVRSARQAKVGELLKIERHRWLHGWTEQMADFNPTSIGMPGRHHRKRMQMARGGARRQDRPTPGE